MATLTDEVRTARTEKMREILTFVHTSSPDLLARTLATRRVRRGIRFISRNAPNPGWWRSCFNHGRCRINITYPEEAPLALVYEYEPQFADEFGYVQNWNILRHFFGIFWDYKGKRLGLCGGSFGTLTPYRKHYPAVVITDEMLNQAWGDALRDPPGFWRIKHRHPKPLNHYNFAYEPPKRSWFSRFFPQRHLK